MLTVMMSTPGRLAAASLKCLVCASQTGVSSDGITLMMRTALPVSFRVTVLSPPSTRVKSGARSPIQRAHGLDGGDAGGQRRPRLRRIHQEDDAIGHKAGMEFAQQGAHFR